MTDAALTWIKVAEVDELPEGRVKTVTAGTKSLALVHFDGRWAAMDNRCPHQGGPLGEGSIEEGVDGKCWIRCPWHGWEFDLATGDMVADRKFRLKKYDVVEKDDGIYVTL